MKKFQVEPFQDPYGPCCTVPERQEDPSNAQKRAMAVSSFANRLMLENGCGAEEAFKSAEEFFQITADRAAVANSAEE